MISSFGDKATQHGSCSNNLLSLNTTMKQLKNIHPGEVLLEEFLVPYEISAYRLSKDIGIPQTRVSAILKGRRRITADTALRLSAYFQNSPKFWIGLQSDFDLEQERKLLGQRLKQIPRYSASKG